MKKILSIIAISVITVFSSFAQDLESATAIYNEGATALNLGDKTSALMYFEEALKQAELLGAEAQELIDNCKANIPALINAIGKELAANKDFDNAIATLNKAIEKATEFGQTEIIDEASLLIPQLYMQQGNIFLNEKNYSSALENYKKVVEINTNDANAYLRMGQAASRLGDIDLAIASLTKAAELGQTKAANKEMASIYLNKANKELKAKDFANALIDAEKSLSIQPSAAAYQIAGTAALQLKDYNTAIENFEGFVTASPNARNIDQIKYQLATAYEAINDKANACVNYKAIVNNPQFKEYAEHKVKNELKCN